MNKTVLFAILEQYADWEYAFLATALKGPIMDKHSPYEVKTLSASGAPLKSIGGFTTLPDYSIATAPQDYAALILIGGTAWRGEEAKQLAPLAQQAYRDGKVLGAICDATVFLGMQGLLNEKAHTSNTLEGLSEAAQGSYTGQANYRQQQAVRDGKLITANGTAYLEFTREVLAALDAYPADYIESNYQYFKQGYIEFVKSMQGTPE